MSANTRRVAQLFLILIAATLLPRVAFAQGAMTNGAVHTGAISAQHEIDTWTFTAAQNDAISLTIGEILTSPDPGFVPWIRLLNPNGVQIGNNWGAVAAQIDVKAPLSGTYTVLVASADGPGTALGSYRLSLAKAPGAFVVSAGDEGGPMTNGADHIGSIYTGDLDMWSFQANQGDLIALSVGEILPNADPNFAPWLRLISPAGVVLGNDWNTAVAQVTVNAPLSGTYTVLIGSADGGRAGTGQYRLMLAKVPDGLTITVPAGDQGGPMVNGANHAGKIHLGDLDTWTFQAAKDDYVTLSVGEPDFGEVDPGFYPWMRLVSPNGTIIGNDWNTRVAQVSVTAPLSGTYTVIIGTADGARVGTGSYLLTLAHVPDDVLNIPNNDQGGPLTNGANHMGAIHMGDLDQWTFQANKDDYIALSAGEPDFGEVDPGFYPWMRVIGPTGVLLSNDWNTRVAQGNITAPLTGTYTVIIGTADGGRLGTGNYILTLAKAPGAPTITTGDQGGGLTNGAIHSGSISMGDLDYWTFQANQNDYIALSVGEPDFGEVDPGFYPWIRLVSPTGVLLGNDWGARVGQIAVNAPLTGTYGVIIGTADGGRLGVGSYNLTLAKTPGDYTFTSGDEGGPMTNTANHSGTIYVGDIDEWWFAAAKGHQVSLTINEPPFGEIDPGFSPWIRVIGPTGALVASNAGVNSTAINFSPTLTGRYTVLVTNALITGGSGSYVLSGSGINPVLPFTVTPSVSGGNGTISPSTPTDVLPGGTTSFTLTPNVGFTVASVGGTCGGTLAGLVYTTAAINADCTVIATFSGKPTMTLANTALQFGAVMSNGQILVQTAAQTDPLRQVGAGTVTWTATSNQPWLKVSPASGTGPAPLSIAVSQVAGLPNDSTLTGSISFTFNGAANNPGPIAVKFKLTSKPENPFGSVDTPTNNRTGVTGAIPFTGWVLDDIDVVRVMICRAAFGTEIAPIDPNCGGAAQIFVGFGLFIEGARPDVAAAFPQYPANTRAGWGFMVLTNMLPNRGNGTYFFQIYGQDRDGHTQSMGTRTMSCSNATATLPFGAIDTPSQGGLASGSSFVNFGWALTQNPKSIPIDGSTITVLVDGVGRGTVDYNHFRSDIASLFPGLANSNGAVGFSIIDTTTMTNGLHTIVWVVQDSTGAIEGIGSRYFVVANNAVTAAATAEESVRARGSAELDAVPPESAPLVARRGWDPDAPWHLFGANAAGRTVIRGEEIDRFELQIGQGDGEQYSGFLRVGNELKPLPAGSKLDSDGTFTWAPGVGFVGSYDLVFVRSAAGQPVARRDVRIILAAKGHGSVGSQVAIDSPRAGAGDVTQPFNVGGWAADLDAAAGTGIETLHVWAYPAEGGAPVFVGVPAYGGRRPDVAAVHGEQFRDSGFDLEVRGLAPGTYDLQVFPWSNVTGGFSVPAIVTVTVK